MKRHVLVASPLFALGILAGCTSILGDFEVSNSSSAPTDDGGQSGVDTGASCTQCGGECVDLASSSAHCGRCGNACTNGQTCQASACKCPVAQAFCDNRCVSADRNHCGPSCQVCQPDEVCSDKCVAAPLPEFAEVPSSPTGWVDAGNRPLGIAIKPTNIPGVIYECRTGPASAFTPSNPPWKPCDGSSGAGTVHKPSPDPSAPEGTYRTELRYRSDTYRSPTASITYYVHHSLDRVESCPRANHPEDGPHFSDATYFAEALAFAAANPSDFPIQGNGFPALGNPPARTDAIYLENPWIHIPFTGITRSNGTTYGWPANGGNYDFNERSLRHKFVMNPTRSLVLVRRAFVSHNNDRDCRNKVHVGSDTGASFGPPGAMRGHRILNCEALVLNHKGNALCMIPSPDKKPIPAIIDERPNYGGNAYAGVQVTVATNSTTAVVSSTTLANATGWYIEIPANSGAWYKIQSVDSVDKKTLTLATPYGVGTTRYSPPGAQYFKINLPALSKRFVIPAGFAKLHEDSHLWATGQKPGPFYGTMMPSPRTKCETPGCADGKPWLTYLPP